MTKEMVVAAIAVEIISDTMEVDDIPGIIDALIGLAWDAKEAGELKKYHSEQ